MTLNGRQPPPQRENLKPACDQNARLLRNLDLHLRTPNSTVFLLPRPDLLDTTSLSHEPLNLDTHISGKKWAPDSNAELRDAVEKCTI